MRRSRDYDDDDLELDETEQTLTTRQIRRVDAGSRVVEAENQARDRRNAERALKLTARAVRMAERARSMKGAGSTVSDPHEADIRRAYEVWVRRQAGGDDA